MQFHCPAHMLCAHDKVSGRQGNESEMQQEDEDIFHVLICPAVKRM